MQAETAASAFYAIDAPLSAESLRDAIKAASEPLREAGSARASAARLVAPASEARARLSGRLGAARAAEAKALRALPLREASDLRAAEAKASAASLAASAASEGSDAAEALAKAEAEALALVRSERYRVREAAGRLASAAISEAEAFRASPLREAAAAAVQLSAYAAALSETLREARKAEAAAEARGRETLRETLREISRLRAAAPVVRLGGLVLSPTSVYLAAFASAADLRVVAPPRLAAELLRLRGTISASIGAAAEKTIHAAARTERLASASASARQRWFKDLRRIASAFAPRLSERLAASEASRLRDAAALKAEAEAKAEASDLRKALARSLRVSEALASLAAAAIPSEAAEAAREAAEAVTEARETLAEIVALREAFTAEASAEALARGAGEASEAERREALREARAKAAAEYAPALREARASVSATMRLAAEARSSLRAASPAPRASASEAEAEAEVAALVAYRETIKANGLAPLSAAEALRGIVREAAPTLSTILASRLGALRGEIVDHTLLAEALDRLASASEAAAACQRWRSAIHTLSETIKVRGALALSVDARSCLSGISAAAGRVSASRLGGLRAFAAEARRAAALRV